MPTDKTIDELVQSSFKRVIELRPELAETFDLKEEDFAREKNIIRDVLIRCEASFDILIVTHALSLIFEDHVNFVENLPEDKLRNIVKQVVKLAREEVESKNSERL